MKKSWALVFSTILTVTLGVFSAPRGYLFIIGGGDRPPSMMKKFVELSQKFGSGKIIIFPMASSVPNEVGPEDVAELKKLGAKEVECHNLSREQALDEQNVKILDNVGGVYFHGGVQSRLTDVLLNTPIHKKMLELYESGVVIGGTSAGAAVMSEIMITGDEKRKVEEGHEFETIQAGNIITTPGFGFIKTAIIDQHFATRRRHNRLLTLMAEHPQLLGIGIDEQTAIIVEHSEKFEVIGVQNVIVYDASQAKIKILPSQSIGFSRMIMHLLLPGDKFDLKRRKVITQ